VILGYGLDHILDLAPPKPEGEKKDKSPRGSIQEVYFDEERPVSPSVTSPGVKRYVANKSLRTSVPSSPVVPSNMKARGLDEVIVS